MKEKPYPEYQDRVVVFLDILGWEDLIKRTENDHRIVDSLVDRMDQVPRLGQRISDLKTQNKEIPLGLEVAHFSDTIVLSCRCEPEGIETIFCDAKQRSNEFLRANDFLFESGLLCRGAVVKGKLFHDGNVLFGPALIEAYKIESTLAIYPRIIVADGLVAMLGNVPKPETSVRRDSDGLYYLDTLSIDLPVSDVDGSGLAYAKICFGKFRESIGNGLKQHGHDLRKRTKWTWLANYFNEVLRDHPELGIAALQVA